MFGITEHWTGGAEEECLLYTKSKEEIYTFSPAKIDSQKIIKKNKRCILAFYAVNNNSVISPGAKVTLHTITDPGFRPNKTMSVQLVGLSMDEKTLYGGCIRVSTDGVISLFGNSSAIWQMWATAVYDV